MEGLIGFFVNTLVMRSEMKRRRELQGGDKEGEGGGAGSIRASGCAVREAGRGVAAGEESEPHAGVQVMFALQNAQGGRVSVPGIIESLELERQTATFDLTLEMVDTPRGLTGLFEYSTDLFDPATINRMIGHFQTLLAGIAANPNSLLSELPLVTERERRQLLYEWNDTRRDFPIDLCMHELFEAQAERTPNNIAVVFEEPAIDLRRA